MLFTKSESAIVTLSALISITVPLAPVKVALSILTSSEVILNIGDEPLASKVLPLASIVTGLSITIPSGLSVLGSKV